MKRVYPEKLLIVWPKVKVKVSITGEGDVEATPAFAVDASRPKQVENAKKWAKNYGHYGYYNNKTNDIDFKEVDNDPFNVTVYGYTTRMQGGVVFKVLSEDGFTYDLRHEEALDVMLKEGIGEGGKINAKFVWSRKGAHMRMVREGKLDEETIKDIIL